VVVDDVLDEGAGVAHGGVVRCARQRQRLGQVAAPGAAAPVEDERLDACRLASDEAGRRGAAGAERRDGARQLALGLRSDREPYVTGAERTHNGMLSCD
jgi:hypothetical protein